MGDYYDIIVVGAGPAGLTAALYGLRAGKSVLVLEASGYGGQIVNADKLENYPGIDMISGFDFATNLYNQVKKLGGVVKYREVLKIDEDKTVHTARESFRAAAVIIATGARNRELGLARERELVGRGVSYCATCDGNFFKGRTVAVVGGGNTALEDAVYLSDVAEKVYLIHRRDTFRGEMGYVKELEEKDNVEFILNSTVKALNGDIMLKSIDIDDGKGQISTLPVDGLFVAVGREPVGRCFANVVRLDDAGYIMAGDDVHTGTPGIYVAGDVRVKELRQLVTAVSDGSIAAMTAVREMKPQDN